MIYVFFDLDETLIETIKTNDNIFRNVRRTIGIQMSEVNFKKELRTILRKNMLRHMDFVVNESVGIDPIDFYFEDGDTYGYGDLQGFKDSVYRDFADHLGVDFDRAAFEEAFHKGGDMYTETKPGILEAVSYIRHYAKTGIITNGTKAAQRKKIKACGAEKYFDNIFVSGEYEVGKPDPRFYKKIIEETGCDVENSFMVGDNIQSDYFGSLAVGLNPIFFSDQKVNYDVVRATTAEEILDIVKPVLFSKE